MLQNQKGVFIGVLFVFAALLFLLPGWSAQATGEDDLPLPLVAKAPQDIFLNPGESKPVLITFNYRVIGTTDTDNRPEHRISASGIELYGNASVRKGNHLLSYCHFGADAGVERAPYYFDYEPFYANSTARYAVHYTVHYNGNSYDDVSYFNVTYAPYDEDVSVVLGGVTVTMTMGYSGFSGNQYNAIPSEAEFDYISGENYAVGFDWGAQGLYTDASLKTKLRSDPEVGEDYYFLFMVYSPVINNHVYDFSQLKPENCICNIDDDEYAVRCIKVTVNPIREGMHDSVEILFRVRKGQKIPDEIDEVSVYGITEPAAGAYPDYSAEESSDAYRIFPTSENGWTNGMAWRDMTAGTMMTENSVFTAGHTYRCSVLVSINNTNYEFANDGTNPTVTGTIGGKDAYVRSAGGSSDIRNMLRLDRDWYIPGQSQHPDEIDEVAVYGITEPVPGAKPSYNAKVSTNEYWVSDESTSRMRNGVLWWDATARQWIGPDDPFVAEHYYRVYINLNASNDFVFATYSDGSFDVTAYVNGERADVEDNMMDETMLTVTQEFYCEAAAARLPGDADLDGKVDMQDALTVVQFVRGMFPLIDTDNADVNGDGKADLQDARLIGQYAAGWNVGLK